VLKRVIDLEEEIASSDLLKDWQSQENCGCWIYSDEGENRTENE
jgi:hypothetical protein